MHGAKYFFKLNKFQSSKENFQSIPVHYKCTWLKAHFSIPFSPLFFYWEEVLGVFLVVCFYFVDILRTWNLTVLGVLAISTWNLNLLGFLQKLKFSVMKYSSSPHVSLKGAIMPYIYRNYKRKFEPLHLCEKSLSKSRSAHSNIICKCNRFTASVADIKPGEESCLLVNSVIFRGDALYQKKRQDIKGMQHSLKDKIIDRWSKITV